MVELNSLRDKVHGWENATVLKKKLPIINRGNVIKGLDRIPILVKHIGEPIILEIGSEVGGSTNYFCKYIKNSSIICLDIWGKQGLGTGFYSQGTRSKKADVALKTTKQIGMFSFFSHQVSKYKNRIYPIKGDRLLGIKTVYEAGIKPDLIYIDCMHTYPECLNDLILCRKLFPDAIITGDDYYSKNDEVKKSVEEFSILENVPYVIYGTQFVFPFNVKVFPLKKTYPFLEERLKIRNVFPGKNSIEPDKLVNS